MVTCKQLYHISPQKYPDGTVFNPRVPEHTVEGEDKTIKRVCFSSCINGCVRGEGTFLTFYFVYIIDGNLNDINIKKPTLKQVSDCKETREYWVLDPVKLKCVGLIDVEYYDDYFKWKWCKKYI